MFRLGSDLHLEFLEDVKIVHPNMTPEEKTLAIKNYTDIIFEPLPNDKETTLILAGDIMLLIYIPRYMDFWEHISQRFKHVIWVFGNHEWFNHSIKPSNVKKAKNHLSKYDNIHILYNEHIELEGVHYIGATLWSNLGDGSIFTTKSIANVSYDYKKITFLENGNYGKLRPRQVIKMNMDQRNFIKNKLLELKNDDKPTYVISHHPPSIKAISEEHKATDIAYWSDFSIFDFETLIEDDALPDLWFHGHIHSTLKYYYLDKRGNKFYLMSNSRGYPSKDDLNKDYNPIFLMKHKNET